MEKVKKTNEERRIDIYILNVYIFYIFYSL